MKKNKMLSVLRFLALLFITLIVWLPIIFLILTSFKSKSEIITSPPYLIPKLPTIENYRMLFNIVDFKEYYTNSFIISIFTCLITISIASIGAYAISYFKFKGKNIYQNFILSTYLFPTILLLIPVFKIFDKLALINSKISLIIIYTAFILPFAIWNIRNYYNTIDKSILDAARICGHNEIGVLIKVVNPSSIPALISVFVYSFITAWSEFIFANVLIQSNKNRPISVGIQVLIGRNSVDFGMHSAAAVAMCIPIVILFLIGINFMNTDK